MKQNYDHYEEDKSTQIDLDAVLKRMSKTVQEIHWKILNHPATKKSNTIFRTTQAGKLTITNLNYHGR